MCACCSLEPENCLFCAHHNRQHAEALAKVAVEIQDETARLAADACERLALTPRSGT